MRIPEGNHVTAFDTYTLYNDVRYFESDKRKKKRTRPYIFNISEKQRNRSIIHKICWARLYYIKKKKNKKKKRKEKSTHARVPIVVLFMLLFISGYFKELCLRAKDEGDNTNRSSPKELRFSVMDNNTVFSVY